MAGLNLLDNVFGADKTIAESQAAADEVVARTKPIVDNWLNRIASMVHGFLDRFTVDITIKLNPYAKAETPDEGK